MIKYVALFIACIIGVLAQIGPSMARVGELQPSGLVQSVAAVVLTSTAPGNDCDGGSSCCAVMCAPCYLPLPVRHNEAATAPSRSQPMAVHQDCLRSIILGRDPPIPRSPIL